jgi:hypothetical protein
MSKIIDKVISQDIEPWNLERVRQKESCKQYYFEFGGCG